MIVGKVSLGYVFRTSGMSLLSVPCPINVLLMFFSQSLFLIPLRSHTPAFPALFWFTVIPHHPFLGNCFFYPLCASVGNSAIPVILLVDWPSVDFVQTVGSAWREGLVLDLQSLRIILSSFMQPVNNRQAPSTTPSTHKANHWHIVVGFYGECSLPLLSIIVLERN